MVQEDVLAPQLRTSTSQACLDWAPWRHTRRKYSVSLKPGRTLISGRKPLTMFAGTLPSYPGEGQGGGEGDTGKDAELL